MTKIVITSDSIIIDTKVHGADKITPSENDYLKVIRLSDNRVVFGSGLIKDIFAFAAMLEGVAGADKILEESFEMFHLFVMSPDGKIKKWGYNEYTEGHLYDIDALNNQSDNPWYKHKVISLEDGEITEEYYQSISFSSKQYKLINENNTFSIPRVNFISPNGRLEYYYRGLRFYTDKKFIDLVTDMISDQVPFQTI